MLQQIRAEMLARHERDLADAPERFLSRFGRTVGDFDDYPELSAPVLDVSAEPCARYANAGFWIGRRQMEWDSTIIKFDRDSDAPIGAFAAGALCGAMYHGWLRDTITGPTGLMAVEQSWGLHESELVRVAVVSLATHAAVCGVQPTSEDESLPITHEFRLAGTFDEHRLLDKEGLEYRKWYRLFARELPEEAAALADLGVRQAKRIAMHAALAEPWDVPAAFGRRDWIVRECLLRPPIN